MDLVESTVTAKSYNDTEAVQQKRKIQLINQQIRKTSAAKMTMTSDYHVPTALSVNQRHSLLTA